MTDISVAVGDKSIEVMSIQYDANDKSWWVTTRENLKVPYRYPFVIVMGKGHAPTLEEAMANAGKDHLEKCRIRLKGIENA
jgi:hypothetical protein